MNLSRAAICLDCWEVFDGQEHDYCPTCGGKATYPASQWVRPLWEATEYAQPADQAAQAGGAHGSA